MQDGAAAKPPSGMPHIEVSTVATNTTLVWLSVLFTYVLCKTSSLLELVFKLGVAPRVVMHISMKGIMT